MLITEAYAQTGGAAGGSNVIIQFLPIILIFVIMYFLILRPQRMKAKKHQEMIANLRRGDTVVTNGGVIGKVTKVEDDELQVEIAEGVKIKVARTMLSQVRAKGEPAKDAG
ncbi:MAG: preprotein translocase subunit YajC [Alphaproteobacteria bacterium]